MLCMKLFAATAFFQQIVTIKTQIHLQGVRNLMIYEGEEKHKAT